MLDALDAEAVRRWSRTAVDLLVAHRAEIDALNVYPVADSDTGSNLVTTMQAADAALARAQTPSAAAALAALAGGAARGALGNSGFIVSQILRGFADVTDEHLDAVTMPAGLDRGAVLARTAVVAPVEGTILSVARAAADAARGATLGEIVVNAVHAADAALQRTPDQLADLAAAGVVDAGGRGLVVLLDALARTVTDEVPVLAPVRLPRCAVRPAESGYAFEVQYLLDALPGRLDQLRSALAALGDSVAVVGLGPELWNVHVHVDDVGAAIEAGVEAGRPHQISVVSFADQAHAAQGSHAVVAVAPRSGLAQLFRSAGVEVVEDAVRGDAAAGAAAASEVAAAVRAAGAQDVVLLPVTPQVKPVADAAAEQVRQEGSHVAVVPTRSPVQALAAIAVHDPNRRFDDDVVAMAEAAAATRHAQVTVATDQALTAVGICEPGDVLGLIDDEVVEIGRGLLAVAFNVVDRLLGVGAELVTILVGSDAPPRTGALLEAHVHSRAPLTDVAVYEGEQSQPPVIIGAE